MKKVATLFAMAIVFGSPQTTHAQTRPGDEITITADKVIFENEPEFLCKKVVYNEKTKEMTLTENVSLKTNKFKFSNAGKVVYNEKTKKLIIYNCNGFTIDGKIIIKNTDSKSNTIEYTLGDDTAYIL